MTIPDSCITIEGQRYRVFWCKETQQFENKPVDTLPVESDPVAPLVSPHLDKNNEEREHAKSYEIIHLNPQNYYRYAKRETAPYAVSLSGGLGSAIAGERAVQCYGRQQVFFWFADVQKEDPELYRFLGDLMARWGGVLYWFTDGRRPEEVWEERHIIPNNRMCPCSFALKVDHFRKFIQAMPRLPEVIIGYKAGEKKRQAKTDGSYQEAIPGSRVTYPIMWEPVERRNLYEVCLNEMGITPPSTYLMGFDYCNCGMDCCRSGVGGRVLEAIYFPARFQAAMEWEEKMRAKGGTLVGKAFCARKRDGVKQPLPLRQILEEYVPAVRSYLAAHPGKKVSEKTILHEVRKWQHSEAARHYQNPERYPGLFDNLEEDELEMEWI
jgi:hypothetical protein